MEELKNLLTKFNTDFIVISDKEIFIPCPVDKYKTMQPLKPFEVWLKSNQAIVIDDCSSGIHVNEEDGCLSWGVICNEDFDEIFQDLYDKEIIEED